MDLHPLAPPGRGRHRRAVETCEICGDCGRDLEPAESVWIGHDDDDHPHPICRVCVEREEPSWHGAMRKRYRPEYWLTARPCEGCGRLVSFCASRPEMERARKRQRIYGGPLVADSHHARTFCSGRCRQRERDRRRRETRREARRRPCEGCGTVFVGTRADARYCSSVCWRRSYRRRSVGEVFQ